MWRRRPKPFPFLLIHILYMKELEISRAWNKFTFLWLINLLQDINRVFSFNRDRRLIRAFAHAFYYAQENAMRADNIVTHINTEHTSFAHGSFYNLTLSIYNCAMHILQQAFGRSNFNNLIHCPSAYPGSS